MPILKVLRKHKFITTAYWNSSLPTEAHVYNNRITTFKLGHALLLALGFKLAAENVKQKS